MTSTIDHQTGPATIDAGAVICVGYARKSTKEDSAGTSKSTAAQTKKIRKLAERSGANLEHVYVDDGVGAAIMSRGDRPEYEALLERIERGDVDEVWTWDSSRLSRDADDISGFRKLMRKTNTKVRLTSGKVFEFAGSDGQGYGDGYNEWASEMALAERWSHKISAEALSASNDFVDEGRHWGQAPFGYDQAGEVDEYGHKIRAINETEERWVNQVFDWSIDGMGAPLIAAELNDAGVKTKRGNSWNHQGVRRVLANKTYLGYRGHKGEWKKTDKWKPIVDVEKFDRAQRKRLGRTMNGPTATGARFYPGAYHFATGVLTCGKCGKGMDLNQRIVNKKTGKRGNPFYRCRGIRDGCGMSVVAHQVDAIIHEAVVNKFQWFRETQGEFLVVGDDQQVSAYQEACEELEELRAQRMDLMRQKLEKLIDEDEHQLARGILLDQEKTVAARIERLKPDGNMNVPEDLPQDPDEIEAWWRGLDEGRQRVATSNLLKHVAIKPAAKPGARFDTNRVGVEFFELD